jgi:hypothetical protein
MARKKLLSSGSIAGKYQKTITKMLMYPPYSKALDRRPP